VTITSDFKVKGDESTISISYKSLTSSVKPGMRILMADGTLAMEVLSVDHAAGTVECEVWPTSKTDQMVPFASLHNILYTYDSQG